MDDLLTKYLGQEIAVHYVNGMTDSGHLVSMSEAWIELAKEDGILMIPIYSIRIVKLRHPQVVEEKDRLLRPVSPPHETETSRK